MGDIVGGEEGTRLKYYKICMSSIYKCFHCRYNDEVESEMNGVRIEVKVKVVWVFWPGGFDSGTPLLTPPPSLGSLPGN